MFSYIGGKFRIGKWIRDYIPTDIETYVEPFSGAFWVFFNMDLEKYPNLKQVVYNDYNPLNANLFACICECERFYEFIKDIPAQEKERFEEYQKHAFSTKFVFNMLDPDYQLALEYIYVVTQVFSGSKPEKSGYIDLKDKYNSKFNSFRSRLIHPKFKEHIKRITAVHNKDFHDVIKQYDSEKTYFYTDPPYWKTENYYSNHDFDVADHERLANVLKGVQGKFGLSYYEFPKLKEWFPEDKYLWERKSFKKAASAREGVEQNDGHELLIKNY
jgi:DNA adenine methylase